MRVIAGKAKGRILKSPKVGWGVRPLTDKARAALFNILGEKHVGANFLDLFAGTGAVGIEALSRGADVAFFVESNRQVVNLIRQNLELTGLAGQAEIYSLDVLKAVEMLARRRAEFDIIYLGAPYDSLYLTKSLEQLAGNSLLAKNGLLIAEHRKQQQLAPQYGRLSKYRENRYGETVFSFYKVSE